MSDTTHLRKLTLLSTFKFGKYRDLTVQQLIDLMRFKGFSYIVWVYYNSAQITFTEDILLLVGILPDMYIPKPGKISDDIQLKVYKTQALANRVAREELSDDEIRKEVNVGKRAMEAMEVRRNISNNLNYVKKFSKNALVRKNHGH